MIKEQSDTIIDYKPYKGPESYQVEDSELFFGREIEADQLISKILSSRFTLLHAQSGAGKTSLLNARIIPDLESQGWTPIRILPQDDPIESTHIATINYVIPSPEAEYQATKRMQHELCTEHEDLTLNELLSCYDELPVRDSRKRELISPIKISPSNEDEALSDNGLVTPLICRVFRSSVEIATLADHLEAIHQAGSGNLFRKNQITGDTRVSQLLNIFSEPALMISYHKLLAQLRIPIPSFYAFFENLIQVYGERRPKFALVLIFDQFEELFTRFIDPGPLKTDHLMNLPDWRLRWEFFDELQNLYQMQIEPDKRMGNSRAIPPKHFFPIRYVISMRSEYIAQLDPIRRFVYDLDDNTYHLKLLGKEAAKVAIQEPAKHYGYDYSGDCYERIIKQLTKEERYVEPAHLQMVCEKLWNENGRKLATQGATRYEEKEKLPQIGLNSFITLGETNGILSSFFYEILEELEQDVRLETLEMLTSLITSSGTRNIIEKDQLINAPFRDGLKRVRLLSNLEGKIVRVERRLGGYFVEITHEFLIGPILEALRKELYSNAEYSRFRFALRTLERHEAIDFRVDTVNLLPRHDYLVLHENRNRIKWDDRTTELMLRSSILHGADSEILQLWADYYSECEVPDLVGLLEEQTGPEKGQRLLTRDQLRNVNEQRSSLILKTEHIESVLRSQLYYASDTEKDNIAYWVRRLMSNEA